MLRITVTENASEQRWLLQGRLTSSFLDELVTNWREKPVPHPAMNRVVDLDEVTFIDKDGEQVLLMMIEDGARFVASGLYTKHLLESLSKSGSSSQPGSKKIWTKNDSISTRTSGTRDPKI